MRNSKDIFGGRPHYGALTAPTVSVSYKGASLALKIDNHDLIREAAYEGHLDPWNSSLCELLLGQSLAQAASLGLVDWKTRFGAEQIFWDLLNEAQEHVIFAPLELLRACLDKYHGKDFLYRPAAPLVCRCFGVREDVLMNYLAETEAPSLMDMGHKTKAGMGCRTCRPQLEKLFSESNPVKGKKYFKARPFADWLVVIDEKLQQFELTASWGLELEAFTANGAVITYKKVATQKEEEEVSKKLQRFLAGEVDPDLGFFLRRSRQR